LNINKVYSKFSGWTAAKRIIRFLKTRVATADHPRMLRGPGLARFWK